MGAWRPALVRSVCYVPKHTSGNVLAFGMADILLCKRRFRLQIIMPSALTNLAIRSLDPQPARSVFYDLFPGDASDSDFANARQFLVAQLEAASQLQTDLPDNRDDLYAWMESNVEQVGQQYREYLDERQAGGKRRYFRNKSHALNFLRSVAPTKMVDGAWLYGLLRRYDDARFLSLIQTYLEELGEGWSSKNHVTLYRKLLHSQGIERWDDLDDEHYVQGAVQLALAFHGEQFLPEIIGYNLGYEQLPLHLLITAYELKELRIDPYYFTLHVTVDNADSGHARKAVDAIFETMPHFGDAEEWYRRVRSGYNLNYLGASTLSVIDSFDLEQEMIAIFARKGIVGQYAHSDGRRVAGRTVNEWLSDAEHTAEFLHAMEKDGWFVRHQEPERSRFWRLIQSEKAKMFGVFNAYEQQVIYDWIRGDAAREYSDTYSAPTPHREFSSEVRIRFDSSQVWNHTASDANDFDAELRDFQKRLTSSSNPQQVLSTLIESMSPANHHSDSGLAATRIFNALFH